MSEHEHYVTVHVSTALLAELREWSQPVQVQVVETPGSGTGYEMIFRTVPDAAEVKVLTEAARKEAGEEIAAEFEYLGVILGSYAAERARVLTKGNTP